MKKQRGATAWSTGRQFVPQINMGVWHLGPNFVCQVLRLCWPWLAWEEMDRPWKGMPLPCDTDMQLFEACTQSGWVMDKLQKSGRIYGSIEWLLQSWCPCFITWEEESLYLLLMRSPTGDGFGLRNLLTISNEKELHKFLQLWAKIDECS
jgi:hypothetical protein